MTEAEGIVVGNLLSKSAAYSVLAAFFRRPERVDVDWMFRGIDETPADFRDGFRTVWERVRNEGRLYSAVVGGTGICPDGEIAHRPAVPAGAILSDIAGFYRAFGYPTDRPGRDEKIDHVSVELNFVSFLFAKEARALAAGDSGAAEVVRKARQAFLSDHLALWIANFSAALGRGAPDSAMGLAAKLALKVVGEDFPVDVSNETDAGVDTADKDGAFACGGCAQSSAGENKEDTTI